MVVCLGLLSLPISSHSSLNVLFGLIPSLSKNQDLGKVRDCKVIFGNMGWNDSPWMFYFWNVSISFLFVLMCSDLIESIRPKRSYWVLRRKCWFGLNGIGKWSCCTADELGQKKRSWFLIWANSWNLKFAELFYSVGRNGKCESSICSLGELRAYCAYSSFFS